MELLRLVFFFFFNCYLLDVPTHPGQIALQVTLVFFYFLIVTY